MQLQVGQQIGEYEVTGRLGEGAMGTVYSGVQPFIGKKVAIKVLKPELARDPAVVKRFIQEARAVNQIGHPNIVDIFSFGNLPNGDPYFVMEHLDGQTLGDVLKERRLSPAELLAVLRPVAEAVDIAHQHGIVHRDLKPDNIFVVRVPGGRQTIKVLDFGVAKLATGTLSTTKGPIGTPLYMAPEQCLAQGEIDYRADIYSLGVIAYHALTGRFPVEADSLVGLVSRHLQQTAIEPPSRYGAPRELNDTLMTCLANDPDQRPRTMCAAVDALAASLGGTDLSSTPMVALADTMNAGAVPLPSLQSGSTLGAAAGEGSRTDIPRPRPTVWITLGVFMVAAAGAVAFALLRDPPRSEPVAAAAADAMPATPTYDAMPMGPTTLLPPDVVVKDVSAKGGLDTASIRDALEAKREDLLDCYMDSLIVRPDLTGDITATFTIDAKGKVPESQTEGIDHDPLQVCVGKVVLGLSLPRPRSKKPTDTIAVLTMHRTNEPMPLPDPTPPSRKSGSSSGPSTRPTSTPADPCAKVECTKGSTNPCCKPDSKPPDPLAALKEPVDRGKDLPLQPTRSDVAKAMSQVRPRITACATAAPLIGQVRVRLRITVAPSGAVASVRTEGGNSQVEACVTRAAKALRLPPSQNGVSFTYPVILR